MCRAHESLRFASAVRYLGIWEIGERLECYDTVNAIGAKNTELSFVVPAKINLATAALGGTGQRYLVNGAHALAVFVFKQNNRLSRHGRRKTKVGKFNDLAAYRLLCGG